MKRALYNLPEPIRFLLAGGVNTVFGYLLFAVGLFLFTAPLEALTPSYYYLIIQWVMWVFSVPFGAFTLKYYAFQSEGPYLPQAAKSYVVYLPAQLLTTVLLFTFTHLLTGIFGTVAPLVIAGRPIDPMILLAQLCSILFATIVSYFGHKFFTFRTPEEID